VLIAIKSLYFTFSALQLRNGYPPPASYRCACLIWHADCLLSSPVLVLFIVAILQLSRLLEVSTISNISSSSFSRVFTV
jgi:hypothetical protein